MAKDAPGSCRSYRRAEISQASNERYLNALASIRVDRLLGEVVESLCRPPFGEAIGFVLSALVHGRFYPSQDDQPRRVQHQRIPKSRSSQLFFPGPLTELKQNAASLLGSLIVCVCCEPTDYP